MRVTTLLENTSCREDLSRRHGLSLFIETPAHRILFDTGPNGAFADNARILNIDLSLADIAFLSHGHYDHSGGIGVFCRENDIAKIFVHEKAFGDYYAERKGGYDYIGMDKAFSAFKDRFELTSGDTVIDSELRLFSTLDKKDLLSASNNVLLVKNGEAFSPDAFLHEQYLIISAEGKNVLVGGCSHRGIVNIMERACHILGRAPDFVFSGFHLGNPDTGVCEPAELTCAIAAKLGKYPSRYFTGHCTGIASYEILKEALGDQIEYMSGGAVFEI